MSFGLMSRTWKWAHVIGREQPEKKCTKRMVFRNIKNEEKNMISSFICHYGCDRGGFCVEHLRSRKMPRKNHTLGSLVIVVTYKDVLQDDFDLGIPSIEIFYLQTGNRKQQTMNRKETMALKLPCQWGTKKARFQSRL
jgi:ribosome biogenesis protein Nip4